MEVQTTLCNYVLQVLWVTEKASGRQDRFNYLVQTAPLSSWSLKRKILYVVHCFWVLYMLTNSGIKKNSYPVLQTSTASHFARKSYCFNYTIHVLLQTIFLTA